MCGICGLAGFGLPTTGQATIRDMTCSLQHRGPDAQEAWVDAESRCALGHARLSIIDLECGGQPMFSADGRYGIVYNGEIYNFQELRKNLEKLGRVFRTRSDTEVLLQAINQWGVDALERLDGMFAFAIYDTLENSLLIARDRVGIKPLYYHWHDGKFAFASEIKALLKLPGMPRRLDYRALADYLTLGYAIAPATFFADIRELPAGNWLKVSGAHLQQGCFWSWRREEEDWTEAESLAKTKEALLTTLEEHMIADVPVGAMLSGGIDSSLLVALLAKELGVRVETFTVSFGDREFDELSYASVIARHLSLKHRRVPVPSDSIADLDEIHAVLDQFDQPFVDSSAIPTQLLCRTLREHVKVAIGGDGGDEAFGGYPRFHYADLAERVGRCPAPLLAAAESLRRPLGSVAPDAARQLGKIVRAARHRGQQRILDLLAYNDPGSLSEMLTKEASARLDGYSPRLLNKESERAAVDGRDMIDVTFNVTLPGDYLRKIDITSMAHGLEVRVPFLGKRILDLAARIPHRFKFRGRNGGKMLLRKMLRQYLPADETITKRGKTGFRIPLDSSLGMEKRRAIETMVTRSDARIRPLIDAQHVQTMTRAFVTGRWPALNWSRYAVYQSVYMLWSLERWLQKWEPAI
jgi:asparagine synthase (glutamine-hydrolysing)